MNLLTEPFGALWNSPRDFKMGFVSALIFTAGVFLTLFLVLGNFAHAALDPAVGQAFTQIEADFDALLLLAWPFIAAVVSGMWVIGMFIRLVYKAG